MIDNCSHMLSQSQEGKHQYTNILSIILYIQLVGSWI